MATPVPPPRPAKSPPVLATVLPLERLWTHLPPNRRQELLGQLTRIVAQRLTPPDRKEQADD